MSLPTRLVPLALLVSLAFVPQAFAAGIPSLIKNDSDTKYQIRVSDDVAPAGVVKVWKADEEEPGNEASENIIKSKNDSFPLEPHTSYKVAIGGSQASFLPAKARGIIVGIHLSIETPSQKPKSASQLHFAGAQVGKTFYPLATMLSKLKSKYPEVEAGIKALHLDTGDLAVSPGRYDKKAKNIIVHPENFEKGDEEGKPLWEITE